MNDGIMMLWIRYVRYVVFINIPFVYFNTLGTDKPEK